MAKFNRLEAGIALVGLLGIASALGMAAYNYISYQFLFIERENIGIEREKTEKELGKLPHFEKLYPDTTDYRKRIVKTAAVAPKAGAVKKASSRPAKAPGKDLPFQKLMKCWKCGKPFMVRAGVKKGRCPHCGAQWALK